MFLGIDHSAVSVADTARSIAFYQAGLGLLLDEQTENKGTEQSAMDAVPNAAVTVTGLKPSVVATPHVELLGYKVGLRRPIPSDARADDVAASFFVLQTDRLEAIVEMLVNIEARFISPGIIVLEGGRQAVAILDPDGHRLVITE